VLRFVVAIRNKERKRKEKAIIQSIAVTHVIMSRCVIKEIMLRFVAAIRKKERRRKKKKQCI
jgi:hypothetical protein